MGVSVISVGIYSRDVVFSSTLGELLIVSKNIFTVEVVPCLVIQELICIVPFGGSYSEPKGNSS